MSREGITIGYLAQDFTMDGERTIYEVATEGIAHLVKALDEFEAMSSDYQADDPNFVSRYCLL